MTKAQTRHERLGQVLGDRRHEAMLRMGALEPVRRVQFRPSPPLPFFFPLPPHHFATIMLRPLLALASLSPFASALSSADIASVFGAGATDLSGNSQTLANFVFSVVTNSS